jgi:hypothetical protein
MSENLYLSSMRHGSADDNPYFEYFVNSVGKGKIDTIYSNIPDFTRGYGGIYSNFPQFQRGYGGRRPQLGYGWLSFLNFFKPLYRKAVRIAPKILDNSLVKRGLHEVVDVASKIASDTVEGKNIKESFKKHTGDVKDKLVQEALENAPNVISKIIRKTTGSGRKRHSIVSPTQRSTSRKKQKFNSDKKVNSTNKKLNKYSALRYFE